VAEVVTALFFENYYYTLNDLMNSSLSSQSDFGTYNLLTL